MLVNCFIPQKMVEIYNSQLSQVKLDKTHLFIKILL